jgi:Repeat of unknown function (DUF5907)/Lower baseplate protein N-terminal domain
MLSRLPVPGSDTGTWGRILNDYLSVEHNSDGTLKRGTDIDAAKSTAQSAQQTATNAQTTANAKYTLPGSGIPEADLSAGVQTKLNSGGASDATTGSKGIVQLAGDLAGTAAAPTVPALAAKAADSAVVHNTGAESVAGVKTFTSSPVVPTPTDPTDAANKAYVDAAAAGMSVSKAVAFSLIFGA